MGSGREGGLDVGVAISVSSLTKFYGKLLTLDHVSFEVEEGEIFGILGPNGAGKTTTIRILTGLSRPTGGRVRVLGFDIPSQAVRAKRSIGVVPESSNLYDELTALENLIFMAQLYGVPRREWRPRAEHLLELFGLHGRADSPFRTLSRGMKRALTIAAALVHGPCLLFLDEPTVGLDVMAARSLRALISRLRAQGITILLTTHYLEEADMLCDRIALLVQGRIIGVDTPEGLKAAAADEPAMEVSFKKEIPGVAGEVMAKSPNLQAVELDGKLRIYGGTPYEVMEAILSLVREKGLHIEAVTTVKPTLEDAFIKLTGLSPTVMAVEKGGRG